MGWDGMERGWELLIATQQDGIIILPTPTSWIAVLSPSSILSNSSMQQMPMSASTTAPASSISSLVTGSLMIAAVSPTPLLPLPVV